MEVLKEIGNILMYLTILASFIMIEIKFPGSLTGGKRRSDESGNSITRDKAGDHILYHPKLQCPKCGATGCNVPQCSLHRFNEWGWCLNCNTTGERI